MHVLKHELVLLLELDLVGEQVVSVELVVGAQIRLLLGLMSARGSCGEASLVSLPLALALHELQVREDVWPVDRGLDALMSVDKAPE